MIRASDDSGAVPGLYCVDRSQSLPGDGSHPLPLVTCHRATVDGGPVASLCAAPAPTVAEALYDWL